VTVGDHDICLLEYNDAVRAEVEMRHADMHPADGQRLHEHVSDLFAAASRGGAVEVKRLVGRIRDRIAFEEQQRSCCHG
jgi:hypothetical protein